MANYEVLRERFLQKIGDKSGCWLWVGAKNTAGYGFFRMGRQQEGAHRAAFLLFKGDIPPGMCVCHSCDTPSCVNPDHLWLGSYFENIQDMIRKGRMGYTGSPGIKNARAKLTPEQVQEIKTKYLTQSQREIAREYGICKSTVGYIIRGETWII